MDIDYSLLNFNMVILRFPDDEELILSIFLYSTDFSFFGKFIIDKQKKFFKNFIIGV